MQRQQQPTPRPPEFALPVVACCVCPLGVIYFNLSPSTPSAATEHLLPCLLPFEHVMFPSARRRRLRRTALGRSMARVPRLLCLFFHLYFLGTTNSYQLSPSLPLPSSASASPCRRRRRRRRYRFSLPPWRNPQPPVAQLDAAEEGAAVGTGGWSSSNVELPGVETPPCAAVARECPPCASCPACPACPPAAAAATAAVRGGDTVSCADVDMGQCRKESLEQTTPHIIECSEAGEGGSQEVRRRRRRRRRRMRRSSVRLTTFGHW